MHLKFYEPIYKLKNNLLTLFLFEKIKMTLNFLKSRGLFLFRKIISKTFFYFHLM